MFKTQIAREYGELVTALCRKMYPEEAKAKAIAEKILDNIDKEKDEVPVKYRMSNWIFSIAVDTIINDKNGEETYPPMLSKTPYNKCEPEDSEDLDLDKLIPLICDNCMTDMLTSIDNETRLVFVLRDVCKLQYKDIAEILDSKEHSLRRKLTKIRRRFNNFLERNCPLYGSEAKCRCGRDEQVKQIGLPEEFRNSRRNSHKINLFGESLRLFPNINYWETSK
ncbi:MAG: RNA polymerase sigma factor [Candidatus Zixiibacteriota bacterium]